AMTGEITLRGRVLPVGGVKEKVLAAHRAGFKTVVLPRKNEKDLVDIPRNVRRDLKLILTDKMDDVIEAALAASPIRAKRPLRPKPASKAIPQPRTRPNLIRPVN